MPRLFNNAASEAIIVNGAANLAGFTWQYGTVALIFKLNNTTGTQGILSHFYTGGINFIWYYDGGTMTWWTAGSGSDFSYSPGTANTHLGVISKATGTVAPLFAFLNMNTGAWTSGAGSATRADQGTLTDVLIGVDDSTNKFRGEMWEVGWWSGYAMTLPEIKRLAGGNFGRFAPTSWAVWPAGRDGISTVGSPFHGQIPMRPSTQVGATRGAAPSRNPPGWFVPTVARRR